MNCKFVVGQKVIVCKPNGPFTGPGSPGPENGKVVTIVEMHPHPYNQSRIGLMLEGYGRVVYWSKYFKPIHEKKTDISIFQEMLTKTPAPIDA
jgi:hypothetical protein